MDRASCDFCRYEPCAPVRCKHFQIGTFCDNSPVCPVTSLYTGQRPVTAALFIHYRLQDNIPPGPESFRQDKLHRQYESTEPSFHIIGSKSVELTFLLCHPPRIRMPHRQIARRHCIHMAVENQRLPTAASFVSTHYIGSVHITVPFIVTRICFHLLIVRFKNIYTASKLPQIFCHIQLRLFLLPVFPMPYDRSIKRYELFQKSQTLFFLFLCQFSHRNLLTTLPIHFSQYF